MFTVTIRAGNNSTVLQAEKGQNLLRLLRDNGISIPSTCGGRGFCGKCKVKILKGVKTIGSYTTSEIDNLSYLEQQMGYHLACEIDVTEDLSLAVVNLEEDAVIMVDSAPSGASLDPDVMKQHLKLTPPSVSDQKSDLQRIEDVLCAETSIDCELLSCLPDVLRANNFDVTVTMADGNLIDVESGDTTRAKYGIAIDIGTTTVVGFLMDINTGEQLDVYSFLNPQRSYGADVISRIDYTINDENGLARLSHMIRDSINAMIDVFAQRNGISKKHIYEVVVVGNTVMTHIFFGLPVKHIATLPFIPVITRRYAVVARDLGIDINPRGYIRQLPNVAGYIGADTVAAILACGMAFNDEMSLMLDLGTNGEIALGNKDMIYACSTAAGPAFEGAQIRNGIGGVKGAINKIIIDGKVSFTTIGGQRPIGICGSGIVDGVSEMLRTGIIDEYGRIKTRDELADTLYADSIVEVDGRPALFLTRMDDGEDIIICQKDIREIQLAKGAVAAGVRILLKEAGITINEIAHVYLAGGFGNYIDYKSACNIGLLPNELRDKIVPIGNAAGTGAKMGLLSRKYMYNADEIRSKVKYIELSTRLDFQDIFVELMSFSQNI